MAKVIKENTPVGKDKNVSANTGSGADNSLVGKSLTQVHFAMKIAPNMD